MAKPKEIVKEVEKIVEKTVIQEVPVESVKIQIVEKIIEKPVEVIKTVQIEKIVEIPVEVIKEIEVEKIVVKEVIREVEKTVEKKIKKPVVQIKEVEKIVYRDIDQNDRYDNRYQCVDCVDEKKQIKKNLQNMSDKEVKRNQEDHMFNPCSVQRGSSGLNIEQQQAPEKIKNFQVAEKIIQNYLFMKPSQIFARQPVNVGRYKDDDFVKYNMDQYHHCKNDDTRISYKDEQANVISSHGYYIISIEWMTRWRHFIIGKGPLPGEVDNYLLKKKIQEARKQYHYPEDEQDLGLLDKQDFYTLSVEFFRFLYNAYGCNQIIQLKYRSQASISKQSEQEKQISQIPVQIFYLNDMDTDMQQIAIETFKKAVYSKGLKNCKTIADYIKSQMKQKYQGEWWFHVRHNGSGFVPFPRYETCKIWFIVQDYEILLFE